MQTTYTTDRDLDNALFAWRSWCRAERSTTAGCPSHAAGCRWRASTTFDDLCDVADDVLAAATDAVLDDLDARLRAAIHHVVLRARWPYAADALPQALADARVALRLALRRRGVIG
jgi:hypothetical protein